MTTEIMSEHTDLDALGSGRIDRDHLARLVARCLAADEVVVEQVRVTAVDYPTSTIATAGLHRVGGTARLPGGDRREYSVFVKQLRSARLWPMIEAIPEEFRQAFIEEFPWRLEIDAFGSPLVHLMPAGLRMARLYDVVEIDAERAAIWMEDVRVDTSTAWTAADYARAARLLGELAGRRPITSDAFLGPPGKQRIPGYALKMYAGSRIRNQSIPAIHDRRNWDARGLGADTYDELRPRLLDAASCLDQMLARLDELPQAYAHGDASPHNLLIPIDEPDSLVAIDWGFSSPEAIGFDLGQLLLGLANSDELDATELSTLEPIVVAAYTTGLQAVGFEAAPEQVREGYALSVAVRSMFTALGLDEGPADEHWTPEHQENRIQMTRYLLDLCEEYLPWTA